MSIISASRPYRVAATALAMSLACLALCGCFSRSATLSEAVGEYVFVFPEKDVEVLILASDESYRQMLFGDWAEYLARTNVLFAYTNSWSITNDEIRLNRAFRFCESEMPRLRLKHPVRYNYVSGRFSAAGNRSAEIWFNTDVGYFLKRVETNRLSHN